MNKLRNQQKLSERIRPSQLKIIIMKYLILLIVLVLTACTNNSSPNGKDLRIIDVAGNIDKYRAVNLSEIADSVEFIPLETTKESAIRRIFYDNIIFENGLFYISSKEDGDIKIFNKRGGYIKTFNKMGRGPGEYDFFDRFDINHITGGLFIQGNRKIHEYTKNDDFVRTIYSPPSSDIDGRTLSFFRCFNNAIFLRSSNIYPESKYSAVILDSSSNIIKKIEYPLEDLKYVETLKGQSNSTSPRAFKYKNKFRIINGHNKYILSINKDLSVDTAFIINYGEYCPKLKSITILRSGIPYLWNRFQVYESDNYLFMMFHVGSLIKKPIILLNPMGIEYNYNHSCSFFKKKSGEFTFLSQPEKNMLGFIDDLEGGPPVWPYYVSEDNYMIASISAYEFKEYIISNNVSEKYRTITESINESDNPIIIKVKLKSDLSNSF